MKNLNYILISRSFLLSAGDAPLKVIDSKCILIKHLGCSNKKVRVDDGDKQGQGRKEIFVIMACLLAL